MEVLDTTKSLLAFLDVSRPTLAKLIRDRRIPVIRVGRNYRYRRADVLAALGEEQKAGRR